MTPDTMPTLIVDLDEPEASIPRLVGGKAAKLSYLRQQGVPVPGGFCITTQAFQKSPSILSDVKFQQLTRDAFNRLISSIQSDPSLIVRSSANYEDSKGAAFPGIFESIPNVHTFEQLLEAVRRCFSSANLPKVKTYCRLRGIDPSNIEMAALIQEYVKPDFSGVCAPDASGADSKLSGLYVEMKVGTSARMLRGEKSGTAYLIRGPMTSPRIIGLSKVVTTIPDGEKKLLRDLAPLIGRINSLVDEMQIIEWVAQEGIISIVQARPFVQSQEPKAGSTWPARISTVAERDIMLPDIGTIGLKAAAMQFFRDAGWFTKNVLFISPQDSLEDFERLLGNFQFGPDGLTVRFSYKGEIGLPRFFARTKLEVAALVRKHKEPEWSVIIHDYLRVRHSFEIFVDQNRTVLEHVPGMWESRTAVPPDVLIGESDEWFALRVPTSRMASFAEPEGKHELEFAPVSEQDLYGWKESLRDVSAKIRSLFEGSLPLICHCVSENHDWQFLNIRTSGNVRYPSSRPRGFHVVAGSQDLKSWDGKQPILLRVVVDRGSEESLVDLVAELPTNNELLFIDFGALSHPAIMLRELGVNPTPVYLTHERIELTD